MRPVVATVVILACAATPAAADERAPSPQAAAAQAAPRAVVGVQEFDAGVVAKGETVEAVFEIRNTGDAELAILSAKPS